MFNNDFDPYDVLISLQARITHLEKAHNKLAHAYQQTEQELTITLQSLRSLQQHHMKLRQECDILKQQLRRP